MYHIYTPPMNGIFDMNTILIRQFNTFFKKFWRLKPPSPWNFE